MLEAPKRDRRAERREATREEILAHAWDLCREQGLTALSLRELAARMGMKAPSLYSYFDSKNAIYDAMYAQGCREYDAVERSLADAEPPEPAEPAEAVGTMMRAFVQFCAADPVRFQLLFQRTIPGFEPSPESYALSVAAVERLARRLDVLGVGGPEMVDLMTAIGSGLASQQVANDPGGDRWVRLAGTAGEMFVRHAQTRTADVVPGDARPGTERRRRP